MLRKSFICFSLLLFGCSYSQFWKETTVITPTVTINISSMENINPNILDEATPLEIKIFQLRDNTIFNEANFMDLYKNFKSVLQQDLSSPVKTIIVDPGSEKIVEFAVKDGSKFVAVFAAFEDYSKSTQKLTSPIVSSFSNEYKLEIDTNRMYWTNIAEVTDKEKEE